MKRFNLFNRSKKEKEKCDDGTIKEGTILENEETIDVTDLSFFRNKKQNHETDEDAISLRSVGCKHKWNGMGKISMNNYFSFSKSVVSKGSTLSFRDLNIINEMGESPIRATTFNNQFSKSMILCSPNDKSGTNSQRKLKNEYFHCEKFINDAPKYTHEEFRSPKSVSPKPITTGGIASRHDSNCSTHSSMKKPWIETEDGINAQKLLDKDEIDRQNIIHELLTGEIDSLNDLKGVVKNYKQPLETLKLLSPSESFNIFYKIENIIPLYKNLINLLENSKDNFGVIKCVGKSLLIWSESLDPIIHYCTHLYYSKTLLGEKRKGRDFTEFLQRCSLSKFSRKLDIWAFLDNPRSRLMKYPLLIERIIKSTHELHPDASHLYSSLKNFEKVLLTLDAKTGEEMCKFYLEKLEFPEQNQLIQLVKSQKVLLLEGNMKISRPINFQKIRAFLFNDVLVLTKPSGEDNIENTKYIVQGNPLPTNRLVLENIDDGEIKMGSFRSTFSSDNGSKNVFRLTLLSNFIPESEFEIQKDYRAYNSLVFSFDQTPHCDKYENSSRDGRLLKNSQTILQVSSSEEKQLWLGALRKTVTKEIRSEEPFQLR